MLTRHMRFTKGAMMSLIPFNWSFVFGLRLVRSSTRFIDLFLPSLSHCVLYLTDTSNENNLISKNSQPSALSSFPRTLKLYNSTKTVQPFH
jgi:hypothetical protein